MAADGASNHSLCRSLVPSILVVVAQCLRALGGARPGSRSHDNMALGAALWTGTRAAASPSPQAHQQVLARRRDLFVSRAAGVICIGQSIRQVRRSISSCRPNAMRMPPNGCFAKLCGISRIHSLASSTRIWRRAAGLKMLCIMTSSPLI